MPRPGPRTFELSVDFLRVNGGEDPLDRSGVHPEAYPVVRLIAKKAGVDVRTLVGNGKLLLSLKPADFVGETFGLPTVVDIFKELEKPGRDPRPAFRAAEFKEGVETIDDLKSGVILEGVVTNVAAFGAFGDVGVHQDGLVHVSAMAKTFVKDPRAVAKLGDVVKVKVLEVDIPRKRIALTMRLDDAAEPRPKAGERVTRGQDRFLRQPEPKSEGARADALRRAAERRE